MATATKKAATAKVAEAEPQQEEQTKKIAQFVSDNGGLVKVTLGNLRDEMGYHRLGKHVLSSMEAHLSENGLGFFPVEVLDPIVNNEPRQWQEINVFVDDDSPEAEVFRSIADPDAHSLVDAVRNLVGSAPQGDGPNYESWSAKRRMDEIAKIAASVNKR